MAFAPPEAKLLGICMYSIEWQALAVDLLAFAPPKAKLQTCRHARLQTGFGAQRARVYRTQLAYVLRNADMVHCPAVTPL